MIEVSYFVRNMNAYEKWPDNWLNSKKNMKKLLFIGLATSLLLTACNNGRYKDLTSGETIKLEKDESTGLMVNSETHKPVYIYVDTKTHDTIYGATGQVINGSVVVTSDGKYKYDGDDEYKIKDGDYKKKVDGDEIKIKDGDTKTKTEDGETKKKQDD